MSHPEKNLKDPLLDQARENHSRFQAKPAKIIKTGAGEYVEFYFPKPSIADLTAKAADGLPAGGTVKVPISRPIMLDLRLTDHMPAALSNAFA